MNVVSTTFNSKFQIPFPATSSLNFPWLVHKKVAATFVADKRQQHSSTQMDHWLHKTKELFFNSSASSPREVFYLFTLTLLTLLLPLSFLLLSNLSAAQFFLQRSNVFPCFLSHAPCNILYILVFLLTLASLIHCLTGKITVFNVSSSSSTTTSGSNAVNVILQSRLCTAWILLCTFQVCVGLGIEGSIVAGVYSDDSVSSFGVEKKSLLRRGVLVFLLGLHETTRFWSRIVVRPVVDDTVFGVSREERWVERLAVAASLGTLWWWRLRGDVEILVVMAEVKKQRLMDLGMGDFLGWWLYYLTFTIGMVRVVKGFLWMCRICTCRRRATRISIVEPSDNDDKV